MKRKLAFTALAVLCLFAASASPQGNSGGNGNGANVVHHDSSLTGDGRAASPLGVANGGVTAAHLAHGAVTSTKLATSNTAQAGQVLGFNGTGMHWVTLSGGGGSGPAPLRVVDDQGAEVGIPIDPAYFPEPQVVRLFPADGTFVVFAVRTDGVVDNLPFAYYESSDCTGTSYMLGRSPGFTQFGMRIGGLFHYPTGANESRHIFSQKIGGGPCEMTDFFGEFSQVTSVAIGDLGTPPFKLAR